MNHDHYHNVHTHERFVDLIDLLVLQSTSNKPVIALDIETTGLNPWVEDAAVTSIALTLCDGTERTWVVPLAHPEGPWGNEWEQRLGDLADALHGWKTVAHNANFDLGYIRRFIPDVQIYMWWDTATAAHIMDENQSKRLKNLGAPLMDNDVAFWSSFDVKDTMNTAWFQLAAYNAYDTIATARLYRQQYDGMDRPLRLFLTGTVLPAQRALIEITHRGLGLDQMAAASALESNERDRDEIDRALMLQAKNAYRMDPEDSEQYPTISWQPTAKWFLAFTEKAVEHDDLTVQEMTPGGRPSWRGGVLERLSREGFEIADTLLAYRDHDKKTQFISSWLEHADVMGRVHGNFNIARTSTGRLSSSDPNLQQVARDLKHLWGPRQGWKFCEIDFSQVEMRVAAELIHRTVLPDNPMLEAFRDPDTDLHSMAATLVTGGTVASVTKEERQKGKAINFGFIFGMGAPKFVRYAEEVYGVDFTLDEAERVRAGFFDLWKGLADWHKHQIETAHAQGYVENLYGRRRRLPALYSTDEWERSEAERQAINSPVQATASDMMLDAIAKIERFVDPTSGIMVGTVHDSVLLEVREAEIANDIGDIMINPSVTLTVPLEVEAEIGNHWGDAETTIIRSNLNE